MLIGYARVSTKDQNEARQIAALEAVGCEKIFMDKKSGKNFDRAEYNKMKKLLRFGDVLFVGDLSRFGRNKEEILAEWADLQTKEIDIVVMNMPILDTRKYKDLPGVQKLVSDLVLTILAWVVDDDRKRILESQRQGIAIAKAAGRYKGRPKKYTEDHAAMQHALELFEDGVKSPQQIQEITHVSRTAMYKRAKELGIKRKKRGVERSD
ncbi:recombinase family protein [Listeria booriae]|uniref:Recombinase family protein n=1 Tax=Listeria booriae TaxID=1552123 RepID=A0A7X1DTL0_9LIST|nr:recombinase family protein [Listeria booriae]MBC1318510.1 recombinase family protein [Listeria booriae]MBC1333518.1 recombinase family protein [Listeria booriae]MBC1618022.1 recombinase family protein [Listeria booriae]MBC2373768.1 recombinase family protein [Listeria booriae]MBC2388819.1 recombinase family protein [Listeria booriae]